MEGSNSVGQGDVKGNDGGVGGDQITAENDAPLQTGQEIPEKESNVSPANAAPYFGSDNKPDNTQLSDEVAGQGNDQPKVGGNEQDFKFPGGEKAEASSLPHKDPASEFRAPQNEPEMPGENEEGPPGPDDNVVPPDDIQTGDDSPLANAPDGGGLPPADGPDVDGPEASGPEASGPDAEGQPDADAPPAAVAPPAAIPPPAPAQPEERDDNEPGEDDIVEPWVWPEEDRGRQITDAECADTACVHSIDFTALILISLAIIVFTKIVWERFRK